MKLVLVAAAILISDSKAFCTQRSNQGETALKWEFPGGKIKPSETPEEALKREIREELSCEISVDELYITVEHQYETFHLTMHCYKCSLLSEKIVLNEHLDSCWLPIDDLHTLDWAPADIPVVEKLHAEWRNEHGK